MDALLDTHTLVWFAWDMPELPAGTKAVLENLEAINRVSIASFWEIGIKMSIGKWDLPGDVLALQSLAQAQGIEIVPISIQGRPSCNKNGTASQGSVRPHDCGDCADFRQCPS